MFDFIKSIWQNTGGRCIIVFVAGMAIGVTFYPSKHIEEKLTKTFQQQIATINQQHSKEILSTRSQYDSKIKSMQDDKTQTEQKLNELMTQITNLKTHQHKSYYKIVHPDGTVEIKASTDNDSEESQSISEQVQQEWQQKIDDLTKQLTTQHQQTVASMQKEWDAKQQQYEKQISLLQQSKVEDVNKKILGLEAGYLLNGNAYVHANADVVGPIFVGVHTEIGSGPTLGAGLGLRF